LLTLSGEQKATSALKEAANVLSDSPSALQLRYLQVIINSSRSLAFPDNKLWIAWVDGFISNILQPIYFRR
jgi:hypothetical protein